MSLKLWFAEALGIDKKYAPAIKLLIENSFGEVQTHFPVSGGDVSAFFKHPVFIATEKSRSEYQLVQPEGRGRTVNLAVLNLFSKLANDHHDLLLLRYAGENSRDRRQSDYTAFQYKHGSFHALGIWTGNKKPAECGSPNCKLALVPTTLFSDKHPAPKR